MPELRCPRCTALLREQEMGVWQLPFNPLLDHNAHSRVRMACWACTWSAEWDIDEVTEPEKELA